jgi:hypothetical protein
VVRPLEWLTEVRKIVNWALKAESTTQAGRMNLIGLVLAAILVVVLVSTNALEVIIRIWRPNAQESLPLIQLFICFCVLVLMCVGLLVYLEKSRESG